MSFDPQVAMWLARHRPDVRRGLVLSGRDHALARWAKLMVSSPHFLAVDRAVLGERWVRRVGRPVYSWTIRTLAERLSASPLVDALIWEADGRP